MKRLVNTDRDSSMLTTCNQIADADHFVDVDELVSDPFGVQCLFVRAGAALSVQCDRDGAPALLTLALGRPDRTFGLFLPMTPATARTLAAGLIQSADMVDATAAQAAAEALDRAKGGAA